MVSMLSVSLLRLKIYVIKIQLNQKQNIGISILMQIKGKCYLMIGKFKLIGNNLIKVGRYRQKILVNNKKLVICYS